MIGYATRSRETVDHPLSDGNPPAWASSWGQDEYGVWVEFTLDGVKQRLRWIPPGHFTTGSPEDEPGRYEDEGPQHQVTLAQGFWLFDTLVTQALWQAVMGDNPSHFQSPQRPVERVSWEDCQHFIARLNQRIPGLELSLPTEAQWEYACRAGSASMYCFGDDEQLLGDYAWFSSNSQTRTHPVGQKRTNAWCLHDMHGNVWEWVQDWYLDGYYNDSPRTDPIGPELGEDRVVRGGSWHSEAVYGRSAHRGSRKPTNRDNNLGFRLAMTWYLSTVTSSRQRVESDAGSSETSDFAWSQDKSFNDDVSHDIKRRQSFEIFDRLLDSCMRHKCPLLVANSHKYLIDISVEGYILERAYFNSLDGTEGVENYMMAQERVQRMLVCPIRPSLSPKLFDHDAEDAKNNIENVIRRKAYWAYQSRISHQGGGDSRTDYAEAMNFQEQMTSAYLDATMNKKPVDLDILKRLLEDSPYMANAIDMYRYCFIRQCQLDMSDSDSH
jgi:hypothetical protein